MCPRIVKLRLTSQKNYANCLRTLGNKKSISPPSPSAIKASNASKLLRCVIRPQQNLFQTVTPPVLFVNSHCTILDCANIETIF